MAVLQNDRTLDAHHLRGFHVFGRDTERADTALFDDSCSRIHATIEWSQQNWTLKDVSKNGTWVDGIQIPRGKSVRLEKDQRISFGGENSDAWSVKDLSKPVDLLVEDLPGSKTLELTDYLLLPGHDKSHAMIRSTEVNGWFLYSNEDGRPAGGPFRHGSSVVVGADRWRVFTADPSNQTPVYNGRLYSVRDLHITLHMTIDEESTHAEVQFRGAVADLGYRSHHYLVAHLARVRAAHNATDYDKSSAGWVEKEQLCRDLGISVNHLNLQIHRAQQHISAETRFPAGAASGLIEKQRGRIRLGPVTCDVYKGDSLVARLRSDSS